MKLMPCIEEKTGNIIVLDIETANLEGFIIPGVTKESNRGDDIVTSDVKSSISTEEMYKTNELTQALSKNSTAKSKT